MMEEGTNQISGIAATEGEYRGNRRLLASEALSLEAITDGLHANARSSLAGDERVFVIEDGSEIRKEHSRKLESMMKVRSLDGHLVNGYRSENAIALSEDCKRVSLLEHRLFSSNEATFRSENVYIFHTIRSVAETLRKDNPRLPITVIGDRRYDDEKIFREVKRNGVDILIRAKHLDRKVLCGKDTSHLSDVPLETVSEKRFEKMRMKNRVYQDVSVTISSRSVTLPGDTEREPLDLTLIKAVLRVRGTPLFREPLFLLASESAETGEDAYALYRRYLLRWNIEQVSNF
jgi:hypothetical protein